MKRYIRSSSNQAPYAVLLDDYHDDYNDMLIYGDDRDAVGRAADEITMKIREFDEDHPIDWTDDETDELMSDIGMIAQKFGVNFDIRGYAMDEEDRDISEMEVVLFRIIEGNWGAYYS